MQTEKVPVGQPLHLRVGEIVEVRSEAEILATLDENGELDGLPFMPEMLAWCGRRLRVDKLALKLCDTIEWTGMYRIRDAVHLEMSRCDGQAHGGCQAGCSIYWKEAWLKRVPAGESALDPEPGPAPRCTLATLTAATRRPRTPPPPARSGTPVRRPSCCGRRRAHPVLGRQAVPAGRPLGQRRCARHHPHRLRSACSTSTRTSAGGSSPGRCGSETAGGTRSSKAPSTRTPVETLDLQPGELVRVKSKEEIVKTLDTDNANRGMSFDGEMVRYCGREARVLRRVEQIIDEKSGRMLRFKNPCIVLEDVTCTGAYHRQCPRGIYPYWREIWLERVE